MIDDPEAPGRGPARLDLMYRWDRVGDLPVVGKFVGVALGVRKGADTLFVELEDRSHIAIRYEHLVSAIQVKRCPECDRRTWARCSVDMWTCSECGYSEVLSAAEVSHGRVSWPKRTGSG